jgi:hypothetical protein
VSEFVCEPFGKHHDRAQFDCGIAVLNEYLAKYAGQDVKRKAAAVFVLVERVAPQRVLGYYALCATSVELSALPVDWTRKLPRFPEIPAILLGRRARDTSYPGVGALLLGDAITRCVRVAKEIAASLIVVDSKGEAATRFYKKFGFLSLPGLPDRMFLPMTTAERL